LELLPTSKVIGATGAGAPVDGTDWNQKRNNRRQRSFGSAQLAKSSLPLLPSVEKDYLVSIRGLILLFLAEFLESGIAAQQIEYWVEAYPIVCRMTSRSLVRLEYADTRDVVCEAFRQLRLLTEMDE
jgi:hypothetical protein